MLQVRNLTKTYKIRGGASVVALNNVSLSFADKGMCFILGKSGSGKSTLLNAIGGLDSFDSGEIIIKGKSSSDFKQSDFDSYRNTYVGFIFQEYNILQEFNVEKNVQLALELQGKRADKQRVNSLLAEVGLEGYGKRKINQLSGGQKQRVAIARALVKDPEIILADEPTGALDSNTGIQVMEALQNLSKTRLVIVVTHDREFAEKYGDRVIEFKDGHVIRDDSKRQVPPTMLSEGFKMVGNDTIQITKGHRVSSSEMLKIMETIKHSEGDVIISTNARNNDQFRDVASIDKAGNSLTFSETTADDVRSNKNSGAQFIKSKLSFKDSFRMGLRNLRIKPVKLLVTIILCMVSFGMFGIVDTLNSYDRTRCAVISLQQDTNNTLSFYAEKRSEYQQDGDYFSRSEQMDMTESDITSIYNDTGVQCYPVCKMNYDIENFISKNDAPTYYYMYGSKKIEYVSDMNDIFTKMSGTYPATNGDAMITKYLLELFNYYGYTSGGNTYPAGSVTADNIVGKTISVAYTDYKICGVLDTKFDSEAYAKLRENRQSASISDFYLENALYNEINYGWHNALFVHSSNFSASDNISYAVGIKPTTQQQIRKIVDYHYANDDNRTDGTRVYLQNSVINEISSIDSSVESMRKPLMYVAIGLAVFASLMLMNFISNSVAAKKREIGILRAVGARSIDVYSIFLNESLIVAVINGIISSVAAFIATKFIGQSLASGLNMKIQLFNFGVRQIILLFLLSILVAVVSSFLPSYRISKKKPIDAINNR